MTRKKARSDKPSKADKLPAAAVITIEVNPNPEPPEHFLSCLADILIDLARKKGIIGPASNQSNE